MAGVAGHDDFWQDTFETIEARMRPEALDAYLKMNLLWSMGKNIGMLSPQVKESIFAKLLPSLVQDIDKAIQH